MGDWILTNPSSATYGQPVVVCYDFENSGESGTVTLLVTYHGWTDEQIQVTPQVPCTEIYVPSKTIGCTGITITDQTGQSNAAVVAVS